MKFFVNAESGEYLGGFLGCVPDVPYIEVPERPGTHFSWDERLGWVAVPPAPPTREEQEVNRQAAYIQEADPLFFKYQRGEATEQEWLDKIEEIRTRYPYPEE